MPQYKIEQIWYKDPHDFFLNLENIIKFIPDSKMTLVEQLNAAFRFALYFSTLVAVIKQDIRVLFFAVFIGIFTYAIAFQDEKRKQVKEGLMEQLNIKYDRQKRACSMPTKENPYMNVLVSDYNEFPNKPQACNINNREVKKAIKHNEDDVYQDVEDVFNRNVNSRQFYTNPVTSIPNKANEFAHWLYNTGTTCKERSIAC